MQLSKRGGSICAILCALSLILAGCSDHLPTAPEGAATGTPGFSEGVSTQATRPGYIRIGVVPSALVVRIGGTGDFVLRDKATGVTLLSGANEEVDVALGEGATSRTNYRLQVTCTSAAGRDELIARAQAAGYATYTENAGPCWRVFLGEFASNASYSVRNAFRNEVIAAGFAGTDSFWKLVTIVEGSTEYRITRNGETIVTSSPVVIEATTGNVLIGGTPYRGSGEVALNSGGALAGINELPIEEYLYGVVPRELPPVPYGEPEAQKAQAVAARTYALSGLGKRRADGYDLLPTTSDQVYGGLGAEHPVSTQAVEETRGVVATYEGGFIQALFFSTSGGTTANNEDVFSSAPIAYLRGILDSDKAKDGKTLVDDLKKAIKPKDLRKEDKHAFDSDWSRYHRWTFEWTPEEISQVISDFAGRPVGRVLAINVLERSSSGRVMRIEYVTEAGSFFDTKDRIRSSLRYINASGAPSSLLSTLFTIEPTKDKDEEGGFVAYGGGWGHGVGLCQTGAVGMAEQGRSYEQILKRYYQGISLETRSY